MADALKCYLKIFMYWLKELAEKHILFMSRESIGVDAFLSDCSSSISTIIGTGESFGDYGYKIVYYVSFEN